ncbi:MAG: ribonuclease III [Desulfovermiculus sp.]|nr:ribonuclease III [Desulfovermiculus sp.]
MDLKALQNAIGYTFTDQTLLHQALTHSSYANEFDTSLAHNERLEFLGDAVLELSVSETLYSRFPQVREGILTSMRSKLVSEPTLARLARRLHLGQFLFLGKGEERQGGRDRDAVLCDALESLFGAIFLDSGYSTTREVIVELFRPLWPAHLPQERTKDFKSRLQELTQKKFQARPTYSLIDSQGPEHAKVYTVELTLPNGSTCLASSTSMKKAEQCAAEQALRELSTNQDTE